MGVKTTIISVVPIALSILFLGDVAMAKDRGDKILGMMDSAMTRVDQQMKYEIVVKQPAGVVRRIAVTVRTKGEKTRRIDMEAPGDLKGMKVLILSRSQIYVYVPFLRRARRIAGHIRASSFLGTTFSYHDTAVVTYADLYKGKLVSESATHWTVEGTRRPGKDFPYPRLVLAISKDTHQPTEIQYYDQKGTRVKTETRSRFKCKKKGICTQGEDTMVDHTRHGHTTTIVLKEWKVGLDLPARVFTVRGLERRR